MYLHSCCFVFVLLVVFSAFAIVSFLSFVTFSHHFMCNICKTLETVVIKYDICSPVDAKRKFQWGGAGKEM